jgi:hypothetical protein
MNKNAALYKIIALKTKQAFIFFRRVQVYSTVLMLNNGTAAERYFVPLVNTFYLFKVSLEHGTVQLPDGLFCGNGFYFY